MLSTAPVDKGLTISFSAFFGDVSIDTSSREESIADSTSDCINLSNNPIEESPAGAGPGARSVAVYVVGLNRSINGLALALGIYARFFRGGGDAGELSK